MESKREDAQFNQADQIAKVKNIVSSHYLYLLQHKNYLENFQDGKVANDDIYEYLDELLGPHNYDDKIENLSNLIANIRIQLDENLTQCLVLLQALRIKDADHAVCTSALLIELFVAESRHLKKALGNKLVDITDKHQAAFHDYDFYTNIHTLINNQLPPIYKNLSSVIKVHIEQKDDTENGMLLRSFSSNFKYSWEGFRHDMKNVLLKQMGSLLGKTAHKNLLKSKQIVKDIEGLKLEKKPEHSVTVSMPADYPVRITQLQDDINGTIKMNKAFDKKRVLATDDLKVVFEQLKFNIEAFFKAYSTLEMSTNITARLQSKMDERRNIESIYNSTLTQLGAKFKEIKSIYENVSELYHALIVNSQLANTEEAFESFGLQIHELNEKIKDLESKWPTACPAEYTSVDTIKAQSKLTEESLEGVSVQLGSINESLLHRITEFQEREQIKQSKLEMTEREESIKAQEERQAFLDKEAKKLQNYKLSIESRRKDKELLQKNSLFATTKPKEEEQKLVEYKNTKMDDLLNKLSPQQLDFILSIINLEKNGITFDQVSNFIVNHLDGKVLEIGNGSSHKRIVLEKYIIKVPVHANTEVQASTTADSKKKQKHKTKVRSKPTKSVPSMPEDHSALEQHMLATGGFHKAHGKAHQPGTLSKFTLGLVNQAFDAAGITKDVIEKLIAKKNQDKENAAASNRMSME